MISNSRPFTTLTPFSFFLIFLIFSPQNGVAQQDLEKDYSPLYCTGVVPPGFIAGPLQSYFKDIQGLDSEDKETYKKECNFHAESQIALSSVLVEGKALYGDPVTRYLNKIGKGVLEQFPELDQEIQFFAFKSSSANAFCMPQGSIFVHLGLLARIGSEAELAFILAHEISHYKMKHGYDKFLESYALFNQRKKKDELSLDSKFDRLFSHSRQVENEADSIGFIAYSKCGYGLGGALDLLNSLYYSYLPFEESKYEDSFLEVGGLIIPQVFKLDSTKALSPITEKSDHYSTHPDLFSRINTMKKLGETNKSDLYYLKNPDEFEKVREVAQFELVNLDLSSRNYTRSLYHSYLLLKRYPNNKYLQDALHQSLYSIALFKSASKLKEVCPGYFQQEGEFQRANYLVRKLTKKQFEILVTNYFYELYKVEPGREEIGNYFKSLVKDLVVRHEMSIDEFNKEFVEYDPKKLPREFHFNAFVDDIHDEKLKETFLEFGDDLSEKLRKKALSFREAEKEKKEKLIKEAVKEIKAKKVLVLAPQYHEISNKKKWDFVHSMSQRKELLAIMEKISLESGIEMEILSLEDDELTAEKFSDIGKLKSWVTEYESQAGILKEKFFTYDIQSLMEKYDTDFIFLFFSYLNRGDLQYYVMSELINTTKIKTEYFHIQDLKKLSMETVRKHISTDMERIQR